MSGWLWVVIALAIAWLAVRWTLGRSRSSRGGDGPGRMPLPTPRRRRILGELPAGVPVVPSTWLQRPLLAPGDPHEVVGESSHQAALLAAAGEKTASGTAIRTVTAQLLLEDANPYDPHAVGVFVGGRKVGYIASDEAVELRDLLRELDVGTGPLSCRGRLTGGWKRPEGDEGDIGLELELDWPLRRTTPDDPFLPNGATVEVDGAEAHAERLRDIARAEGSRLVATLVEERAAETTGLAVRIFGETVGRLPPPETAAYLPIVREVVDAGLPATCEAEVVPGPVAPRIELALAPAGELAGGPPARLASGA